MRDYMRREIRFVARATKILEGFFGGRSARSVVRGRGRRVTTAQGFNHDSSALDYVFIVEIPSHGFSSKSFSSS